MSGAELAVGSVFAGHRVLGVAGRGGMGVVYRALDVALDRVVALKLISPAMANDGGFRERFRREARLAARIRHPHAVTVYGTGEHEGSLYLTMEHVDGADLGALIAAEGRLEPARAARLVTQVCGALDELHRAGLVHRDLKPANVLVGWRDGAEHALLTDFGLSRAVGSDTRLTQAGFFVGTLHYAAPEQFGGESVDARADVYALGCVLYEALTGEVPYPVDTARAQLAAVLTSPPPSPRQVVSDVPSALDTVVARACAKDPAERYPSAGDLGRAAHAATTGAAVAEPERSVAQGEAAPRPPPERNQPAFADRATITGAPAIEHDAPTPTRPPTAPETAPSPVHAPTPATGEPMPGPGRARRRAVPAALAGLAAAGLAAGGYVLLSDDTTGRETQGQTITQSGPPESTAGPAVAPPAAAGPLRATLERWERVAADGRCSAMMPLTHSRARPFSHRRGGPATAEECAGGRAAAYRRLAGFRVSRTAQLGRAAIVEGTAAGAPASTIWALDEDGRWRIDPGATLRGDAGRQIGTEPSPSDRYKGVIAAFVAAHRSRDCATLFRALRPDSPRLAAYSGDRTAFCEATRRSFERSPRSTLGLLLAEDESVQPDLLGATAGFGLYGLAFTRGEYYVVAVTSRGRDGGDVAVYNWYRSG